MSIEQNIGVESEPLFGRHVIYYDDVEITAANVADVIASALPIHNQNVAEIEKLYAIYRGEMAIRNKAKSVREEINNKITANFPNYVVSFHTGYFLGKPIQYVSRGEKTETLSDAVSDRIDDLNRFAEDCGKSADDTDLAEWMFIAGVGYRMALPSQDKESESPFDEFTLDPRCTLVVRSNEVGHRVLLAATIIQRVDGTIVFNCYTDKWFFKLETPDAIVSYTSIGFLNKKVETVGKLTLAAARMHYMGYVPIVEYTTGNARLGAFELILPLADAINAALSDLADGTQQFINALLVIKGADITDEQFSELRELGGLKVPADGDVKYLVQELNQSQGVERINLMIDIMLQVTHMPKRSGGSGGTSDNGVAVFLRDGFIDAESYANRIEQLFKKAEKEFLRIVLRICSMKIDTFDLKLSSVEPHFTRQNTDNLLAKVQALTTMLATNKIHPLLAFTWSGLCSDPEAAWSVSAEYEQSVIEQEEKQLQMATMPEQHNDDNADNGGDAE